MLLLKRRNCWIMFLKRELWWHSTVHCDIVKTLWRHLCAQSVWNARDLYTLRQQSLKTGMRLSWKSLHGLRNLKSWSVNTALWALHKCRLKPCHAKKKPYLIMIQRLWAKDFLKWTEAKWKAALWSDECNIKLILHRSLHTKDKRNHFVFYKNSKDIYWF